MDAKKQECVRILVPPAAAPMETVVILPTPRVSSHGLTYPKHKCATLSCKHESTNCSDWKKHFTCAGLTLHTLLVKSISQKMSICAFASPRDPILFTLLPYER